MALQFIFGNPGSGKSHYLYEHIIRESMKHPDTNYIILVPEQFTMQTQKELVLDFLTEQTVSFRLQCSVVDCLRFCNFTS